MGMPESWTKYCRIMKAAFFTCPVVVVTSWATNSAATAPEDGPYWKVIGALSAILFTIGCGTLWRIVDKMLDLNTRVAVLENSVELCENCNSHRIKNNEHRRPNS